MARIIRSRLVLAAVCLVLLGVVAWADVSSSPRLEFHMFYLVPIVMGAWYVGGGFSLVLGLLSAGAADLDFLRQGEGLSTYAGADTVMRLVVFAFVAWAITRLRRTNRQLRASESLREDLTHMLVHDLKNPLTSASLALRLFRRPGDAGAQLAPDDAKLLDIVAESQGELGALVDDLLIIARGESGAGVPLQLEPADLRALVHLAVEGFRPRAEERGLEVVESSPAEALTLALDLSKVRRLLENLLDNALKNTPAGGQIAVTVARAPGGAQVTVRDTGAGIPRDQQAQIFDRFAQASAQRGEGRVSVGLGLTFCRLVVEAHGGRLWVESEPGHGTAFSFVLPAEPDATKSAA